MECDKNKVGGGREGGNKSISLKLAMNSKTKFTKPI